MSKIIAIAALGKRREIGTSGKLPWTEGSYRDDMMHFTRETKGEGGIGHPCIMTLPSWESIPEAYRPLAGRPNIIVSRRKRAELNLPDSVHLVDSPEKAVHLGGKMSGGEKLYICGGTYLYEWAVRHADELLITEIPEEFPEADAFFPEFLNKGWEEVERNDSPNEQCVFVRYTRRR